MLLYAAFLAIIAGTLGQLQLVYRDSGKLCTQWLAYGTGQISLTYTQNQECSGEVGLEWGGNYAYLRLCCPAVPATTASSVFPRECGLQQYQPATGRIVGGTEARANSWPWQVRLHANGGLCGGTLIDERHVLTAAHCFKTPIDLSKHQIFVGLHDINKPVYNEQMFSAERIFLHEQYNDAAHENDIAIIRLSRPVTLSDKVNVICLPGPEALQANETVWVAGWGTTSFQGSVSPVLRQTKVHIMPNTCENVYRGFTGVKQVCAGAHGGGRDSCQGDSGGPLMYESNGKWYLNGVVSYGNGCAIDGYPGVYARVSFYLPWIRAKLTAA